MATLQEILTQVQQLRQEVEALPGRINVSAAQVTIVNGLSDLSEKLGLIQAGEFRTGNRVSPGDGFSGVRIGYPGFTYGGALYNIAGVDADTLMAGMRSSDGTFVAGAGAVIADVRGILVTEDVTPRFQYVSTSGIETAEIQKSVAAGLGIRSDTDIILSAGEVLTGGSGSTGAKVSLYAWDSGESPEEVHAMVWRADLDQPKRGQLDLFDGVGTWGAKISLGPQIELHAQGSAGGQTFLLLNGSSDTPSTSGPPSLDAGEVRMYYRSGNLVFQVHSTGDTDEDRYFYTRMSGTDASSDWTISTDPL